TCTHSNNSPRLAILLAGGIWLWLGGGNLAFAVLRLRRFLRKTMDHVTANLEELPPLNLSGWLTGHGTPTAGPMRLALLIRPGRGRLVAAAFSCSLTD